jgi:hypothetical protein
VPGARCSLGLRPLKACFHGAGVIGVSTGPGVGAPLPCFAAEPRLVRLAVESWVVGACWPKPARWSSSSSPGGEELGLHEACRSVLP